MLKNLNNTTLLTTICGGKNCHVVIIVKKPEQFNFDSIKNTLGSCVISGNFAVGGFANNGGNIAAGNSIDIHIGEESLVCDCQDKYTENAMVLKNLYGTIVKSKKQ